MSRGRVAGCLLLVAARLAGASHAQQAAPASPARTSYDDMRMFSQVLNQIRVNHVDSVNASTLMLAAVEGMIRASDPHSYLLPASRTPASRAFAFASGEIVPAPLAFVFVGGSPVLVSVAPGTAAARVDLLPGDALVTVDGQPITARSAEELELLLAGPRKSEVRLGLDRRLADGSQLHLERTVKRERAEELESVPVATMLDRHTAYVRLISFRSAQTAEDVRGALRKLSGQGMERLILDLRDNGGGSLAAASAVAGVFLAPGTVIAINEFRRRAADTLRADTSASKLTYRVPLVVLVNEGTASASELVAGAIQDHDRGLVVGRPTFGKALIMQPFPLADGSVMWLTTGRTRTPCGRVIQRDYRHQTIDQYYRGAGEAGDSATRPRCTTASGRVLLGGGGIEPDIAVRREAPRPAWLSSLASDDYFLQWLGQFLQDRGRALASADDLLDDARLDVAVADLREFAARRQLTLPSDAYATADLRRLARNAIAWTRFGPGESFRLSARTDHEVAAALAALDRAAALPGATVR